MIPGVTAISAAAAAGAWPLSLQKEQLHILPTPDDPKTLEALLIDTSCSGRVLALLKLGNRWSWVRPLLEKKGLIDQALFAQRIGLLDEQVMMASQVSETTKPYFSLLLIRQSWPKGLP